MMARPVQRWELVNSYARSRYAAKTVQIVLSRTCSNVRFAGLEEADALALGRSGVHSRGHTYWRGHGRKWLVLD